MNFNSHEHCYLKTHCTGLCAKKRNCVRKSRYLWSGGLTLACNWIMVVPPTALNIRKCAILIKLSANNCKTKKNSSLYCYTYLVFNQYF